MAPQLPYGAAEIVALRSTGKRPADLVLVSLVGPLRETNPVLIASPCRAYDWRALVGLAVAIVATTETPGLPILVRTIEATGPASLSIWFADSQDGLNLTMSGHRPVTKDGRRMSIAQRIAWAGMGTDKTAAECRLLIAHQVKRRAIENAGRFEPALVEMAQVGFRGIFGKIWGAA